MIFQWSKILLFDFRSALTIQSSLNYCGITCFSLRCVSIKHANELGGRVLRPLHSFIFVWEKARIQISAFNFFKVISNLNQLVKNSITCISTSIKSKPKTLSHSVIQTIIKWTIIITTIIIYQIFSLACDWSKCVTWVNIPQPKLGIIPGYSPIFKTNG